MVLSMSVGSVKTYLDVTFTDVSFSPDGTRTDFEINSNDVTYDIQELAQCAWNIHRPQLMMLKMLPFRQQTLVLVLALGLPPIPSHPVTERPVFDAFCSASRVDPSKDAKYHVFSTFIICSLQTHNLIPSSIHTYKTIE